MRNKVRDERIQRGMTQEEMAERLGVSRQTIISIESGRYNPSIILAYKLACLLGMSIEKLFLCAEQITTEENHD